VSPLVGLLPRNFANILERLQVSNVQIIVIVARSVVGILSLQGHWRGAPTTEPFASVLVWFESTSGELCLVLKLKHGVLLLGLRKHF